MELKEIATKVKKHDTILSNHESRISSIESKFDFIRNTLTDIKDRINKPVKFSLKNLNFWRVLVLLIILFISAGVISTI